MVQTLCRAWCQEQNVLTPAACDLHTPQWTLPPGPGRLGNLVQQPLVSTLGPRAGSGGTAGTGRPRTLSFEAVMSDPHAQGCVPQTLKIETVCGLLETPTSILE